MGAFSGDILLSGRWVTCEKSERELGISHTQVFSGLIIFAQDGGFTWRSFGWHKCISGLVRGENLACYFFNWSTNLLYLYSFCPWKDGRTEIIANDVGDRVTPALVACVGGEKVKISPTAATPRKYSCEVTSVLIFLCVVYIKRKSMQF